MFTGITRGTFPVVEATASEDLLRFTVELDAQLAAGLELGASVSVDGVCQTVVDIADPPDEQRSDRRVTFEAIRETLDKTTLGELEAGSHVSIERSLTAGQEIGGHEVAGHVNGTGEVVERRRQGDVFDLRIAVPAAWLRYIFPKGYIALDGSSLTVGEVVEGDRERGSFWVHLIPETLRLTKFATRTVGDRVNVELDARTVALVDSVERILPELVERLVQPQLERLLDRPDEKLRSKDP